MGAQDINMTVYTSRADIINMPRPKISQYSRVEYADPYLSPISALKKYFIFSI
jgi:hypothetical protein